MKINKYKVNATLSIIFFIVGFSAIGQTTYYVEKSGSDDNIGSEEGSPFLTIQKAADLAEPGDMVIIGDGIYRERVKPAQSGTAEAPITYIAREGSEVVVSGMEVLNGWTQDQGNVFKRQVPFNLGNDNMILYNGVLCHLARYPNKTDTNPFKIDAQANSGGSLTRLTGSFPDWDWSNGGFVWYLGKNRWTSWRANITSWSSGEIGFQGPGGWEGSAHDPKDGGEFVLYGIKEALDNEYEFYFQTAIQTLFIVTPSGEAPLDGEIEMKKRTKGFDLSGISYLVLDGINHHGCAIDIKGTATGNTIKNLKITWGNHTLGVGGAAFENKQSIDLSGSNNKVERCEIAWGANTGIWLAGENNIVENCIIHDFNYLASYGAPIMARSGSGSKIIGNTLFNAGRDVVQSVNLEVELAYNDLFNSNLINDDCGTFYTCCGTFNMEIHHNFFHDSDSRGDHFKAAGIYLDNDAKNIDVHHNVVFDMEWTGIQMNWDNWNFNLFNNTLWNVSTATEEWTPADKEKINVKVFNNLSNEGTWIGTDIENNLVLTESPFVDYENNNFQLKENSEAIDFGKELEGITDEFMGNAPDAGAFEFGVEEWIPGADWLPSIPSDLNEVEFNIDPIFIAPNPTADFFTIKTPSNDVYRLEMFSAEGGRVKSMGKYRSGEVVNVEDLQQGIYFLVLQNERKIYKAKLMILE